MAKLGSKPRLGVVGGTFNPVHNGHLRLALQLAEQFSLEHVALMPCALPVHKGKPTATAQQRLDMLNVAVANEPKLVVDTREINAGGKSYSVQSLKAIRDEIGQDGELYFAMGSDSLAGFNQWYQWQDIIKLCHLVHFPRPGNNEPVPEALQLALTQTPFTLHHLNAACLDISSSDIRARVQSGKSIRYLLPETVYDYIHQNYLYND